VEGQLELIDGDNELWKYENGCSRAFRDVVLSEQFGLLLTCNMNALVTIVLCDTIDEVRWF